MKVFPGFRHARRQMMAFDFIVIIRMHRLTELNHDKIRNINYIINGTDTCPLQTLLHPFRRWTDLYIADHAG